ncbi:MAG: PH domain-containing protein [Thermoanaerobaculia bacterium]
MDSSTLVFPSKVDWWIATFMLLPAGASVVVMGSALLSNPPIPAIFLVVGIEALILGIIVGTLISTRYEVTGREVIARSGLFQWRVAIDEIDSIRPSRSLIKSPALSLDRLEIRYGNRRRLLVSPKDREGFLEAVVMRSGHLRRAGEHVRRV